jgi:hypothetical protein
MLYVAQRFSRRAALRQMLGALAVAATLATTSAMALPRDIVIGAHEAGSRHYVYGAAFTDLLTKHSGMSGKLVAVAGSGVWLPMMEEREVDVGIDSFYGLWQARAGVAPFQKKHDIKLILVGGGLNVGLYVRNDSDIKSRKEIRGRRVGAQYAGAPNIATYAEAELANAGLGWGDVEGHPRTSLYAGQKDDVAEKRLDVFYASVGSGVTRELDATIGIRFLGLDESPAAMAAMNKVYPVMTTRVEPGPPGIREPMSLVYLPAYLVARGDLDDDVVYAVVKAAWEKNAELAQVDNALKSWTPDRFVSAQAALPYHPGAIRYYKERGVWSEAMEKANQARLAGN